MGSGKTTVGKKLAAKLGMDFYDLDKIIEEDENKKISEIFEKEGEEKFRWIERNALKKTIITIDDAVISTGGGTPCFNNNIILMKEAGITVYLEMTTSALASRIKNSKSTRPLLENLDEKSLPEFIESHITERKPFYEQAHLIINGIDVEINQLSDTIRTLI